MNWLCGSLLLHICLVGLLFLSAVLLSRAHGHSDLRDQAQSRPFIPSEKTERILWHDIICICPHSSFAYVQGSIKQGHSKARCCFFSSHNTKALLGPFVTRATKGPFSHRNHARPFFRCQKSAHLLPLGSDFLFYVSCTRPDKQTFKDNHKAMHIISP